MTEVSKESWLFNRPIAHRGIYDNKNIAENSLPAFLACIQQNIPIELDVRITKDKKLVVFHDDKLARMTDVDGYVVNLEYQELKNIKLLKTTSNIPLLSEVLSLVDGKVPLLIEIKNINGISFEKELYDVLSGYKGEYAIQSFSPFIVEWFKLNAPSVKRGILSSYFKKEKSLGFFQKQVLKKLKLTKRCEPNFISYDLNYLPNKYVKKYADIPVIAWSVNSEQEAQKAKKVASNYIYNHHNYNPYKK